MRVADFDYHLPQQLIAQHPLGSRDQSRLLVLDRKRDGVVHSNFATLGAFLAPGDLLVLNDTRVLPARLYGEKPSGGKVEVLLLNPVSPSTWSCLVKPARRVRVGTALWFGGQLRARVTRVGAEGMRELAFSLAGDQFMEAIHCLGQMPLPPYIRHKLDDPERYQTVYASSPGAVAAPTAGLHFTAALLAKLAGMGIDHVFLTLHVGLGTFRPVKVDKVDQHRMHSEYYHLPAPAAAAINDARRRGGRIVAVGTTVVRVLETLAEDNGAVRAGSGWTEIFIYPGHQFRGVDAMVTNFHLPRSTLLMLVAAFAGHQRTMEAYRTAVEYRYRFYSFGDAMLIL